MLIFKLPIENNVIGSLSIDLMMLELLSLILFGAQLIFFKGIENVISLFIDYCSNSTASFFSF